MKSIKEEDKTPNQYLKAIQATEKPELYLTNLQPLSSLSTLTLLILLAT